MNETPIKILGLSFFYHDAAAALIVDGRVAAAAQEERFTRVKHDKSLPAHAIAYCLDSQGVKPEDLQAIVFYDKPLLKFERLLQTYIRTWPKGLVSFLRAMQSSFHDTLWVEKDVRKLLHFKGQFLYCEHHYAHAASAFYCSEFSEATVITMDGVGEWDTTTIGFGKGNQLTLSASIHFPDSLGLLYSALTYYLGFKVNSAEYKVMGLAPYGNPDTYAREMSELVTVFDDGSFRLNRKYFAYEYGLTMTSKAFDTLFGGSPRKGESAVGQREMDIAAALQKKTEEIVCKIVEHAQSRHPSENLCLAGGVALNCVANGKLLEKGYCKNIYIQPAAGDAGGAVGAALYAYYAGLGKDRVPHVMPHAYLGPVFSHDQVIQFLREEAPRLVGEQRVSFQVFDDEPSLASHIASLIADTNVIGVFHGRMEFGPRALGNRSIIADARVKENWQKVNLKIKFRESFRPFAPAVLEEYAEDYFDLSRPSPYMLLVAPVTQDTVPAITHVDRSARIQTVNKEEAPFLHSMLTAFYERTHCPVVINTSFNVRGEPIVGSLLDAFQCFINTDMDYLVLEHCVIDKKQNSFLAQFSHREKYLKQFQLD